MKSILGNCYRHLAIFFWSHWPPCRVQTIWKWFSCQKDSNLDRQRRCCVRWPLDQRTLVWWEVLPYGWPPVYFVWIHLLCLCWISNSFTCLVKSKPFKQEVSYTVILPPMVSVLWPDHQQIFFQHSVYFYDLASGTYTFSHHFFLHYDSAKFFLSLLSPPNFIIFAFDEKYSSLSFRPQ